MSRFSYLKWVNVNKLNSSYAEEEFFKIKSSSMVRLIV
jgi:hypothetical protein